MSYIKGLFTWRWETPGRWGNPPGRGRKIKRFYMQSNYPGVQGWGLLLRLQLRSLSKGVPSSHLEKDERLILGHLCIYLWKRHALCYAVFGFARNRWLNTLYGIVWETKYGRFITYVRCGFWWFLPWDGQEMYKVLKHTCFAFELFSMNVTPARRVTPPWHVYIANCHPGWQCYPTWQTGQPT